MQEVCMKTARLSGRTVLLLGLLLSPSFGLAQREAAPDRHGPVQSWDFRDWANPEKMLEQLFGPESERELEILKSVTISTVEEREYGGRACQAFLDTLKRKRVAVTRRGKDVDYLQALAKLVQSRMRNAQRYRTLELYIAETDEADARCFPGGTLVVFRGLLDDARSEAALVGVLGHELSHIDHGHQLQFVRRLKVAEQTFAGGFDPRRFLQNGPLLLRAFSRPFRPEDEVQADRDAAVWAFQSGYDPREFAELFHRMAERRGKPVDLLPAFLRSHPHPLDRRRDVIAVYQELRRDAPEADLYIGQENLRQRIPRDRRRFPE